MMSCQQIIDVIAFFQIYGEFAAIRKLDSGGMFYKTYMV